MSRTNIIMGRIALGSAVAAKPNGTPSALVITVLSDTSLKLDWTRGSTNNDGAHIYNSSNVLIETVTGTAVTKTLTGLTAGTLYSYYVKEYKGNKESAASNTASGVTTINILLGDGNTFGWYDPSDLTTITKDGSNLVSQINDKVAGVNNLVATGTQRPTWSSPGVMTLDGIANMMQKIATLNQPETIYMVVKQITWENGTGYICDGGSPDSVVIYQVGTSPQLKAYAGTLSTVNSDLALDTWGIIRFVVNGASSKFQINESTAISWNAGAKNAGGFTLGAKCSNILWGNIAVKDIIIRKVAEEVAIFNYLKYKHGFFLT
jgi:hypothetical protein